MMLMNLIAEANVIMLIMMDKLRRLTVEEQIVQVAEQIGNMKTGLMDW